MEEIGCSRDRQMSPCFTTAQMPPGHYPAVVNLQGEAEFFHEAAVKFAVILVVLLDLLNGDVAGIEKQGANATNRRIT